jgi:hypothetical protein
LKGGVSPGSTARTSSSWNFWSAKEGPLKYDLGA